MAASKSRGKSRGRPFTGKDDPRNGHGRGPARGAPNAGRKPLAYKRWLASLLDSDEHRKEFEAATKSRADPRFEFATRHATEYGHGKPAQDVKVNATVTVLWDL